VISPLVKLVVELGLFVEVAGVPSMADDVAPLLIGWRTQETAPALEPAVAVMLVMAAVLSK